MREWRVRWNGTNGYEWDLLEPGSDLPIGGLWSDGLNSPHIKFILDACNEKERRLAAGHVAGCWGCGQSPCIHSYVSSNLSGDFDD